MEGLPPFKHAMKEKDLMIIIDLKVLAFVCQWANSINPFLGSVFFLLGEGGGRRKVSCIPFGQPPAITLFITQQISSCLCI